MTQDDVIGEFRDSGALREGHFILSSGLHLGVFLQKNLVFMHPDRCERLCKALAQAITKDASAENLAEAVRRIARLIGYFDLSDPGVVRNFSDTTPATVNATYIVPAGTPNTSLRVDKDNPGCAQS